jgi:hypothetical protein
VELQWRRLQEMKTGKGRRWGATIFRGEGGRSRGGSTMLEADDTVKSGMATEDSEA